MLKNVTRKDKRIKFCKAVGAPVLMYGSENWDLNDSEIRKIETAEVRCWGYHMIATPSTDHIENTYRIVDRVCVLYCLQSCCLTTR
jgi:hypothetical protein